MKTSSSTLVPQAAFWGMCLIVIGWLAATVLFETHLGWPVNGIQWMKRLVGWGVEVWLVRTLIQMVRRYGQASAGRPLNRIG